ncbi:hypothetical protein HDV00_006605 [Rhizophlyctis rosea]|nr:hypothetical protein HDV00_006605 [Rhizophlyctis rosea]
MKPHQNVTPVDSGAGTSARPSRQRYQGSYYEAGYFQELTSRLDVHDPERDLSGRKRKLVGKMDGKVRVKRQKQSVVRNGAGSQNGGGETPLPVEQMEVEKPGGRASGLPVQDEGGMSIGAKSVTPSLHDLITDLEEATQTQTENGDGLAEGYFADSENEVELPNEIAVGVRKVDLPERGIDGTNVGSSGRVDGMNEGSDCAVPLKLFSAVDGHADNRLPSSSASNQQVQRIFAVEATTSSPEHFPSPAASVVPDSLPSDGEREKDDDFFEGDDEKTATPDFQPTASQAAATARQRAKTIQQKASAAKPRKSKANSGPIVTSVTQQTLPTAWSAFSPPKKRARPPEQTEQDEELNATNPIIKAKPVPKKRTKKSKPETNIRPSTPPATQKMNVDPGPRTKTKAIPKPKTGKKLNVSGPSPTPAALSVDLETDPITKANAAPKTKRQRTDSNADIPSLTSTVAPSESTESNTNPDPNPDPSTEPKPKVNDTAPPTPASSPSPIPNTTPAWTETQCKHLLTLAPMLMQKSEENPWEGIAQEMNTRFGFQATTCQRKVMELCNATGTPASSTPNATPAWTEPQCEHLLTLAPMLVQKSRENPWEVVVQEMNARFGFQPAECRRKFVELCNATGGQ